MDLGRLKRFAFGIGSHKADPGLHWRSTAVLDRGALGEICLALDGQGQGMALWENGGGVWSLPVGSGSSPALMHLPLGEGTNPRILLNQSGRGLALWQTENGDERRIQGKILGGETEEEHRVFRTTGRIHRLQAAVDRRGNALVIWLHEQDGRFEVMAQSFDIRDLSWEQEPRTLSQPPALPLEPRLAVNQREHAMVLWEVQEAAFVGLVASHYWPNDRIWSDRTVPVVAHATRQHQVAMDDQGNALAIWINLPQGRRSQLEASFYDVQTGEWQAPVALATAETFTPPRLAMSGSGEALAVWCQGEAHGASRLFAKAFRKGQWEAEVETLNAGQEPVVDFAIALDPDGKAGLLVVHQGPEGSWVSARLRQKGWSLPKPLTSASRFPCSSPRISFSPQGASALWVQGEGAEKSLLLSETR